MCILAANSTQPGLEYHELDALCVCALCKGSMAARPFSMLALSRGITDKPTYLNEIEYGPSTLA